MRIDELAVMTGMARYDGPSRDGHGLKVTRHDGPSPIMMRQITAISRRDGPS